MQFYIQLYSDVWKITPYLQANPYRPKTKNINPKKAERVDLTPPVVFQKKPHLS